MSFISRISGDFIVKLIAVACSRVGPIQRIILVERPKLSLEHFRIKLLMN